ncbi:lasso peptide biosynthesis PqqD family chaperone [Paenibacillus sp. 1011MAR3C5]|uniref:lasso peptide biosynthesis PqqD family chaperone n=1 Tax=Paenibacillus sp. 1011MAR3C5 TaxID=1675787 RepID=UPI000E6C95BD|nr:lasso peptide biosynthesis PqqD family chaperone [Paenibacillus sp. 1011MAR3C5]RJE86192.1 lasso peptide biosynthesis PqqD family chaperone [Paenibacillus sp. 1011MAR3C5]
MIAALTMDSLVSQAEDHLASDVDGEKVLLHTGTYAYYNLGDIGGDIWSRLEGAATVRQVVDALLIDYAVERPECERRVLDFLEQLYREGLIRVEA